MKILRLTLAAWAMLVAGGAVAQDDLRSTSGALATLGLPGGISIAFEAETGKRELVIGSTLTRADITEFMLRAGIDLGAWVHFSGAVGGNTLTLNRGGSRGGGAGEVAIDLNLIEQIVEASPVAGKKQSFGVMLRTAYSYHEANRGSVNTEWNEFTVTPLFHYTVNRRTAMIHPHSPQEASLLLGAQYSDIDGDSGPSSLRGNRDVAVVIGGEFLTAHNWAWSLSAITFGHPDTLFRLTLARYF